MNSIESTVKNIFPTIFSILLLLAVGCQTPPALVSPVTEENNSPDQSVVLREGDTLKITFPSNPRLDTAQSVRRDGKIALPVFGEIQAAGFTPAQLEKQIVEKFGKELVSKEVSVTLESSQISVFVNGAILRPGKIESPRPITALEAIMEAGGFNYATANLKAVKVIRTQGDEVKTFVLDFRGVLAGQPSKPFYVKSSDIIYVPEKFTVF
jgi:protein involved in polysaccharide export with SLBB domain